MSAQAIYVFLLAVSFLPLLNAQYVLRGQAPPLTAPPVFVRQILICPADYTSCTDGGGGCCEIGAPCAFSNGTPICNTTCGLGPICTSDLDGLCCNLGYTCNYQSTLCISTTELITSTSTTPTTPAAPSPTLSPPPPLTVTSTILLSPTSLEPPPSTMTSQEQTSSTTMGSGSGSTSLNETPKTASLTKTTSATASELTGPSTPATQSVATGGKDKLGLSLKVLLGSCGLVLLWG
jgi:hypothetical protein